MTSSRRHKQTQTVFIETFECFLQVDPSFMPTRQRPSGPSQGRSDNRSVFLTVTFSELLSFSLFVACLVDSLYQHRQMIMYEVEVWRARTIYFAFESFNNVCLCLLQIKAEIRSEKIQMNTMNKKYYHYVIKLSQLFKINKLIFKYVKQQSNRQTYISFIIKYSGGPSKCFFELGRRMKFII
ncbi:Hypothetical_protein [Hexamita inflata]|uniref:Hypothetical_protein n=1 Tax=Hexamita inflata TaxID=28002 RepID=A0AA86NKL6_9EUKA|nr:Hypothetical protein HINF_LOCUS9492 [Hexamita inflata]